MLAALTNFAAFTGLTVSLGAVALRFLVLPRTGLAAAEQSPAARHAAGGAAIGAALLLVSAVARAATMAQELAGPGEPWTPMLRVLLLSTTTGEAIALQAIWAAVAVLGFTWARADRERGWRAAAVAMVVLALTPGMLGHPAASERPAIAMTTAALHVLGGGAWIGGLFHLWRSARVASEVTLVALIGAFHRVATVAVALLVLSGLVHLAMTVPDLASLGTSAWGRLYLVKVLLVVVTLVIGYGHWRNAEAAVRRGERERVRASLGRELLLAVAVLAITGLLTTTAPPE